jgi:cation diffusion facilitator family transporter
MTNTRAHEIKKVCIISALSNSLLAIIKIMIGFIGQSQALIADGLHSVSDLLADGLVMISSKWGEKAPDLDHPYGHRRIETLSTIIIALLLLVIAGGILFDSIQHIIHRTAIEKPSAWVMVAAAISILTNEGLFRFGRHVGLRIHSPLLIANAWHNRSDALSSLIVLLSVIGCYFSINIMDLIGAILIALLITRMAVQMILQATNELIDAAVDPDTLAGIEQQINSTKGVIAPHQIRTRSHSGFIFIDAHIIVNPTLSVSEGHYIGEQVKAKLMQWNEKITDVTVHIDSEDDEQLPSPIHLPNRQAFIELIQTHCTNCPGINNIIEYQIHYINNCISCTLVLPLSVIDQDSAKSILTTYKKQLENLDIVSEVRILFRA